MVRLGWFEVVYCQRMTNSPAARQTCALFPLRDTPSCLGRTLSDTLHCRNMRIMEATPTSSDYEDAAFFESEKELAKRLDWYAEYEVIRPLFQRLMQYSDSILVLGPGTSGLHEQLYDSGYRGITCVDFSSKVLQMWRQRSADAGRNTLKYQLADVAQGLSFEHYPYNVIVDKGTTDCILCRKTGLDHFGKAIEVVWNNLKKPGVFVMISHGTPDMRLPLLQQTGWESIQVID